MSDMGTFQTFLDLNAVGKRLLACCFRLGHKNPFGVWVCGCGFGGVGVGNLTKEWNGVVWESLLEAGSELSPVFHRPIFVPWLPGGGGGGRSPGYETDS